jgi:hypothetical protein
MYVVLDRKFRKSEISPKFRKSTKFRRIFSKSREIFANILRNFVWRNFVSTLAVPVLTNYLGKLNYFLSVPVLKSERFLFFFMKSFATPLVSPNYLRNLKYFLIKYVGTGINVE